MVYAQINAQTERDLLLMESIAIPLSFLVLVWVFGGLVAAALPMLVGGLAIVGSMSVLRLITFTTDVSIFALNLSTAMGLALAIDYTLLIISRYRDELADGAPRDEALVRTMSTAGRTVLFSATTVALSMAAMLLFPMYFLKSFAYAGIATVAFAAAAAVIVTPAAIWLLGDRLDALDVRKLGPPAAASARARAQARRAAVLVPLDEGRDAPGDPDRAGRRRAAAGAGRAVPRRQVGLPRRPGAAHVGVGPPGRRPAAQRLRRQLVDGGHRRHARRRRADSAGVIEQLRRRPVPGARRVVGVRARPATFVGGKPGRTAHRGHRESPTAARSSPSAAPRRCSPTPRRRSSTRCTTSPAPDGRPVQLAGIAQINRDSVRGDHRLGCRGCSA